MPTQSKRLAVPVMLMVLAASLFLSGWWQSSRMPGSPRVKVLSGRVLAGDQEVSLGSKIAAGMVLTLSGRDAAVTLQCARGEDITLTGEARFTYLGATSGGHDYELSHGKLFLRSTSPDIQIRVRSPLGTATLGRGIFELLASAMPTGSAIDTPRTLRLSVGKGSARLSTRGKGKSSVCLPAGIKALIREGTSRVLIDGYLLPGEWEKFLGRKTGLGNAAAKVAEIPVGAWIPRQPGSKGATPGSRTGIRMWFDARLKNGVLSGGTEEAWLYDAVADRWARAPKPIPETSEMPPVAPQSPAGAEQGSIVAFSSRAQVFIFCGKVSGNPGTWTCRPGTRLWTRLDPPANPPPRSGHALYYDSSADVFVLYGGELQGVACDDVWIFRPR